MAKKFVPFKKEYPGFESVYDLERDISEWLEHDSNLPGEFTGTLKVSITYEKEKPDPVPYAGCDICHTNAACVHTKGPYWDRGFGSDASVAHGDSET